MKDNLKMAYEATLAGMSVYRTARMYTLLESTVWGRTRTDVDL